MRKPKRKLNWFARTAIKLAVVAVVIAATIVTLKYAAPVFYNNNLVAAWTTLIS